MTIKDINYVKYIIILKEHYMYVEDEPELSSIIF